ncbi:MAG: hypothetical protein ACE14W_02260 [Candidatus Velamenicoccus archaeovorus]
MDAHAPPAEPLAEDLPPAEGAVPRRSDRWEAGPPAARNPWAWLSVASASLGVAAVVVVALATAERPPFEDLPDRAAYVLFGAVPSLGVLAFMTGLSGRHGAHRRWVAWTGIVVGALLALGAIAVTVVLLTALRTLG